MSMKMILAGLAGLLSAGALLALCLRRKETRPTDCIDGGVRHYNSGEDAPKEIRSEEMIEFRCTISRYAACDGDDCRGKLYKLTAVLQEGKVLGSFSWNNRITSEQLSFTADPSFMVGLHKLVVEHNLVRHNGYSSSVSGLPDMYGDRLDIRYASGECIYAYDNQNGFLSEEAWRALLTYFSAEAHKHNKE